MASHDDKKFLAALDAVGDSQKLMAAVCTHVLADSENAFHKARGMSDAFLASMYVSLGRADAQKIIDGMSEYLALIKDD